MLHPVPMLVLRTLRNKKNKNLTETLSKALVLRNRKHFESLSTFLLILVTHGGREGVWGRG